ncbi:uncharacterized protein LOC113233564 [Hyposmocoma kahamanoa]|uniref:uncharacterized protein LOC113233564 n=1 Tax=Hyposmocoma kahamanoa TaxID=1477025 RepID=UPI000E6D8957|nr:uncharacterized protein LOC113233564 [Hyposmocoma kahamanoa]
MRTIFLLFSLFHYVMSWSVSVDTSMEIQNVIPDHLDLQKIAHLYINNEKYKVLKPAIHSVTDHFQNSMRRETELPSDRVFIDGNGFRHFWNVFKKRSKSLRRVIPESEVDIIEGQDNVNAPSRRKGKPKTAKASKGAGKANSRPTNVKVTTKPSKTTVDESKEETEATTRKSKPTTASPTTKDGPKRKTPGRYSVRKKLLNKKKLEKSLRSSIIKLIKKDEHKDATRDGKETTLVKTTFFCPFFGVMTMHSYLDDDAPKPAEEKVDDKKKGKDEGKDKANDIDKDKEKKKEDEEKKE